MRETETWRQDLQAAFARLGELQDLGEDATTIMARLRAHLDGIERRAEAVRRGDRRDWTPGEIVNFILHGVRPNGSVE